MRKVFLECTTALILSTICSSASAETITVPGMYSTVAAAIAQADDGDTIEIEAGTYTSDIVATVSQDDLTIKGVGGDAHLNADGLTISNGKAIFVTTGDNITLENIEFSHTTVPDKNGAGIRHEGGLLTINNCYFHDNENGILTSGQGTSGELVINYSEFEHNGLGSAGYTHNIYVGKIGRFVFNGSYSHLATHGHNIKSRAQQNYILYSRIMDEDSGNASYQIDLPNGGLSYIIGNIIQQGVSAENYYMISYAAEGATNPLQQLLLINNTLVNDRSNGHGIRLSSSPYAVIQNNIFDNLSVPLDGTATIYENNLESTDCGFVNRASYNYQLTENSPAINAGSDPGSFDGISLTPTWEYLDPLQRQARPTDSTLDIGAYEYSLYDTSTTFNLLFMILPTISATNK